MVIPDLENPFFTAVVRGIELVLQAAGYTLLLANSDEDAARERNILETLRAEGVAGIIFVPINAARDAYRDVLAPPLHTVAVDRSPSNLRPDLVTVDNVEGTRAGVAHLLAMGHRDVALLGGPSRHSTAKERERGYEDALRAAGRPLRPSWCTTGISARGRLRRDEGVDRVAAPPDGGVRRQQPDDAGRVPRAARGRHPHSRGDAPRRLRRHALGDLAEPAADRGQPALAGDRIVGRRSAARPNRPAGSRHPAPDPGNEAGRQGVVRRLVAQGSREGESWPSRGQEMSAARCTPVLTTRSRRLAGGHRPLVVVAVPLSAAPAATAGDSIAGPVRGAPGDASRARDAGSRIEVQGRLIRFALHGHIRFDTLAELFRLHRRRGRPVAVRVRRGAPGVRGRTCMRRGVESRVVSMETELPLELAPDPHPGRARARGRQPRQAGDAPLVFKGQHWQLTADAYRDAFLRVRDRWSRSLNCWSASPSIPGRVLSNWYVIDEGIELFGATYDSTEHFWQAVKYHPDVTVGDLQRLLAAMRAIDWRPWVDALAADQAFYFANAYAVEFLKRNLARERLELVPRRARPRGRGRTNGRVTAQQRVDRAAWRADRVHRARREGAVGRSRRRAPSDRGVRRPAGRRRVPGRGRGARVARRPGISTRSTCPGTPAAAIGFLSAEFQALMLEIWKVKFLKIPRLGEVIRSTAGVRLDHFLNDGDSPDIPIPIYVGYLNRIREMAMEIRP